MRILYGVCGEGYGHSSRAKEILHHLEKKGHKIKVITYGRAYPVLKDEGFDVFRVEGLEILFRKGKLSLIDTVKHNLMNMAGNLQKLGPFMKMTEEFKPEICISDMEPLVPIYSFWYHLPLISIDNQHRITNLELKVPQKYLKDYLLAKLVVHQVISSADVYLVTSFSRGKIIHGKTIIIPPIVRKEVLSLTTLHEKKGLILVYLTKPENRIASILKRFPNKRFIAYGFNRTGEENNITYKKNRKEFLEDLGNCEAIIATAGFTLMSEALYLKKPYFALPLQGQFEQMLNALFLKEAGYGEYHDEVNEALHSQLEKFLGSLPQYRKSLLRYNADNHKVFKAVDDAISWASKHHR